MSDTAQQAPEVAGGPPPEPETGGRAWSMVKRAAVLFAEQRAATVLVVVILLVVYFGFFSSASSTFLTKDNIANITWTLAPWAIIAIGEVFLLVCGELDLSVGFVLGFSPFLMHYLIDFYGVPPVLAVLLCLLMGLAVGFANGFITVTLGVPSFITTLGTGFIIEGILLVTSHAYPATIPAQRRRGRQLAGLLDVGGDHLDDRPGRGLPDGAQLRRGGACTRSRSAATSSGASEAGISVAGSSTGTS